MNNTNDIMNNTNDIMRNIYDTLLHLRYPYITNVEVKDLETTILSGENRVCLLSWLLTEKLPSVMVHLEKLKDVALEDKLFEYYFHIGICDDKDVLLGKCSLKKQLPTLRILLDFMKKVHVESFANTNETKDTLMDIVKVFKMSTNDTNEVPSISVVKPKVNYADAIKYFEENKKDVLNNDCESIKSNLPEDSHRKIDDRLANDEQNALFDKEKEKFIEAFQTILSWPVKINNLNKNSDAICSDIKSICSNFSTLKEILQAKDEISNVNLLKELPTTTTPLTTIIEDIVICNEELKNLFYKQ